MLQNITAKLLIDGLALRNDFSMHNTADVKNNYEHALDWVMALSYLLELWRWRAFPLRQLLLYLGVVSINLTLITSDVLENEGWVISNIMMEILTHVNTTFFLLSNQQARDKLGRYMFNSGVRIAAQIHTKDQHQQCHWLPSSNPYTQADKFFSHFQEWHLWQVIQFTHHLPRMFFHFWSALAFQNIVYGPLPCQRKLTEACYMSL